jgi:hypothetical protein
MKCVYALRIQMSKNFKLGSYLFPGNTAFFPPSVSKVRYNFHFDATIFHDASGTE